MGKSYRLPCAQLLTLRTKTLLHKGLNHLQKYDFVFLTNPNEDASFLKWQIVLCVTLPAYILLTIKSSAKMSLHLK